MKVALHAINGVGLGHLSRMVTLAGALREAAPGVELLVLTNARDLALVEAAGLDCVQLPPREAEPHADPARARTALPADLELAACRGALEAFGAELVVFDTHAPRELVQAATDLGARTVLVLRELRPEALAAWFAGPAPADFDAIVMPHDPDEVTPPPGVRLVGPIVRAPGALAPEVAALAEGAGPLVVAVAGGGGQPVDAARFLESAADAHWLARSRFENLRTILVTGPYAGAPRGYPGLTVLPWVDALPALMARADVVVAQAGYNTIAELRLAARPAVLVPGHRKQESQRARAARLVRAGAAVLARPESRALAVAVEALLADPARRAAMEAAHRAWPLVPRHAEAAAAVLRPVRAPAAVRRVVIVAHDFPPRIGGMETVALEVARGLAARGLAVTVYTAHRLGIPEVPGVRVRPLFTPLAGPQSIDLLRDLALTLDALAEDAPDAVHLAHAGLAPWVPALRAVWPARVTVSLHGNDFLAPWVHSGAAPEDYRAALEAGLRAADAVLPVSRFAASLAARAAVDAARVRVTPNGVDTNRFHPSKDIKANRLVTVSRLAPRKGHATVIRALALLKDERPELRWAFTGAAPALAADLMALARDLGVADRVEPLGWVTRDELPALYASARAFVLVPDDAESDVEGFGVALLEAQACGVPIVASRTGGVPEAVEDGGSALLVPPGDVRATAEAILRLVTDEERATRMGARGRVRAERELGWDRTCDGFVSAWTGPIGTGPRFAVTGPDATPYPHVAALRRAFAGARHAADLARIARGEARGVRLADAERRARFARAIERGETVKLRATGDGGRLLSRALADCAALGHRPDLEIKLRRFVDADFRARALPLAGRVHLHHGVPSNAAAALLEAVAALPGSAFADVDALRLHLGPEAKAPEVALTCVPEVHALRAAFAARGVTVLVPPELARYLSVTPAGGPKTAMIEPTNRCNLACPTCPTGTGKIAPLPDMTPARFERVLDGLTPGLANLALWNYGEPTLHRELPALVAAAKRRGVGVVKVSSNVHFADGPRGVALLESGLDVLILSVDGASQESYATFRKDGDFARVARGVQALCDEKRRRNLDRPRIELQFIVMRHNEHELDEIRRLAAEWGVDRLRIKTFGADDGANRALVPQTKAFSRYGSDQATPNRSQPFCTMAWDHSVVNVDGAVTPCCYLRPDMGPQFVMGNVFETSFREIWRGAKYRDFRRRMLEGRQAMPVCDRCRGGTSDLLAAVEEVER